ncbi:DVU_1553 family AMP-dependent CoA ligase [Desulfovibrio sp. ZJ200]|uniref:DVU_1553 family AMP-dependent CoA ligase n=1 Tax=Desulfovibrio sp. ZJ200 TaxID=2709792 RepID=UPI001F14D17D|nr:AMP-binding protein [Desulfovibrio sp. ZJ200]
MSGPSLLDLWLARACGAREPRQLAARLREAQAAALRRTLRYALERSAFYARRLAQCDLNLRGPEDLPCLPFTQPSDLRNWRDFLCVSQGEVRRMVTLQTSGTTGSPKRLAFTDRDLARTRDFFRAGMSQLVGPGQRLAVLLPGAERPDGVADLLRQALAALGVAVAVPPPAGAHSGADHAPDRHIWGDADHLRRWLRNFAPHCLVAAPAQLALLLRIFPEQGPPGLRGVLSSADRLDPGLARRVRHAWGCALLDHYGLTETAFGCAVECAAHDGYHLRELDVLAEIVDAASGAPLPPGEAGEVVITTLDREAMPLIRYRTGDVAALLPGPCACGSPLRRLGPVLGRLEWVGSGGTAQMRLAHPAKGAQARIAARAAIEGAV